MPTTTKETPHDKAKGIPSTLITPPKQQILQHSSTHRAITKVFLAQYEIEQRKPICLVSRHSNIFCHRCNTEYRKTHRPREDVGK